MNILSQIWIKLSPRVRWIIVGVGVLVTFIAIILYKLHSADKMAQQLRLQLMEATAKQKIAVINGDIKAEQVKADVNQQKIDTLTSNAQNIKGQLEEVYKYNNMSSDDIVNRFKQLNMNS